MLHDFADVLCLVASGDEQRVFGFDDDQIMHADHGDELFRSEQSCPRRPAQTFRSRRLCWLRQL